MLESLFSWIGLIFVVVYMLQVNVEWSVMLQIDLYMGHMHPAGWGSDEPYKFSDYMKKLDFANWRHPTYIMEFLGRR